MTVNQVTTNRGYPKPWPSNELQEDVEKLRQALDAIDVDISVRPTLSVVETLIAAAVANVLNGAPGALDTLQELANALGNDASFAASVTNALAGKAPLNGAGATGTWNISITGNAATATTAMTASAVSWSGVTGKPSTITGYGIDLSGNLASTPEALAGVDGSKLMTPATTAAVVAANRGASLGLAIALG